MKSMAEKPLPRLTEINRPFFEACNRNELLLQRCQSITCGRFIYYPRPCCPYCGNDDVVWQACSGNGSILSFSRIVRPQSESFSDDVPYYFVAVKFHEGPTMFSRLVANPKTEAGLIGQSVRAVFIQHTASQKLPFFTTC